MDAVTLNKNGYDPFIDFIKGFCILSVVLTHSLPVWLQQHTLFSLWGGMAVPLFLMIQVFHAYKSGLDSSKKILSTKILKRIIIPFLVALLVIGAFRVLKGGMPLDVVALDFLKGGGGPGSYYPWIYVQFAVCLTLIRPVLRLLNFKQILLLFVILSILLEVACSVFDIHPKLYRVTIFRYVFLIALGLDWIYNGIVLDKKRVLFSIVGICFIVFFEYADLNMEPVFLHTDWRAYHWVCYFYMAWLLAYLLKFAYNVLGDGCRRFLLKCGKYSYEVFLLQMIVFSIVGKHLFSFVSKPYDLLLWFLFVNFMSVVPVLTFKDIFAKRLKKNELR